MHSAVSFSNGHREIAYRLITPTQLFFGDYLVFCSWPLFETTKVMTGTVWTRSQIFRVIVANSWRPTFPSSLTAVQLAHVIRWFVEFICSNCGVELWKGVSPSVQLHSLVSLTLHASASLQCSRSTLLVATRKCHLVQRILNCKFITVRRIKSVSMNIEVQASLPRIHARGATLELVNRKPNKPLVPQQYEGKIELSCKDVDGNH